MRGNVQQDQEAELEQRKQQLLARSSLKDLVSYLGQTYEILAQEAFSKNKGDKSTRRNLDEEGVPVVYEEMI
jgi:hypothetical protein